MPEWLMNALTTVLSWLMALTSSGVMTLSEPPAPPEIPDTPDTMTQEITVLSFNIWTDTGSIDKRMNGVLETIRSEMPDSFGLQEAHELWRQPLKRALQNADTIGAPYGIACNWGRYFGVQEGTPIFYRKDKYKLVKEGVFWLSDRPRIASVGWDAALPRIAGYAVLKDKQTGFTYVHFNAHFDHVGATARANSARLIADRINAMGLPAVFTADVNAGTAALPAQYFAAGGLTDLRGAALVTDTGPTFHAYSGATSVIDYIYANHYLRDAAQFKVIRDEYDGQYPSDHFAVAATFTLAN